MNKKIIAILIGLIMFLNPILVLAATENFTTYTEEDPNTHITVTASRVTVTGLLRSEDAWVVKDKTAGHFDGDFEHLITVYIDAGGGDGGQNTVWGLANLVDDYFGIDASNGDMLSVWMYSVANPTIRMEEMVAGTRYTVDQAVSLDTLYYLKIVRDETVGTYGTIYSYIYSDAARTNLLQTLTLTLHEKEDFRYIYAAQTGNSAQAFSITGYCENLDLQEDVEKRIIPTQVIE